MIPIMEGMRIEERAKVEKIAPNCPKVQPFPTVQYVPMVVNQAPQTKNCRKLIAVNLYLIVEIEVLIASFDFITYFRG